MIRWRLGSMYLIDTHSAVHQRLLCFGTPFCIAILSPTPDMAVTSLCCTDSNEVGILSESTTLTEGAHPRSDHIP